MRSSTAATIATYGLLGAAATITFLLPGTISVPETRADDPAPPDQIILNGVVRDFRKDHPDFSVIPAGGNGHYAGNVNLILSGNRQPVFVDGGYKVQSQWRDSAGRAIAPHMSGVRGGFGRETLGFRVDGSIHLEKDTFIDAFNSNYGPYGAMGNFGADALVSTNSTKTKAIKVEPNAVIRGDVSVGVGGSASDVIDNMGIITGGMTALAEPYEMPALQPPEDLEPFKAIENYQNGTFTLTGDTTPDDDADDPALHFGELTFRNATIYIEGDLRILCDVKLMIDKATVILLPEANLTFYVDNGNVDVKGESQVNVTPGDTTKVNFNVIGNRNFKINKSQVYASLVGPDTHLLVEKGGQFGGGFIGKSVSVDDFGSAIHVDRGNARTGPWNFAVAVRDKIELEDGTVFDCFDSNEGVYGGPNVGDYAWINTNATKNDKVKLKGNSKIRGDVLVGPDTNPNSVIKLEGGSTIEGVKGNLSAPIAIPMIAAPYVGVSVGDLEFTGGTHTVTTDVRCKHLKLKGGAILNIQGDRIIRCDDKLEMDDFAEIRLLPGATLTFYLKKDAKIEKGSKINMNTGNPQLVSFRRTSVGKKAKVELKDLSQVCAWIQGAKTELKLDNSEFYGSFAGEKLQAKKGSRVHVDMAYLISCVDLGDAAGVEGSPGDGGITSAATFEQWYRNILGLNQAGAHSITLSADGGGVYEYLDDAFHPIDDQLLGNESETHNNYFTYAISAEFDYVECGGQFVDFTGGDGAWLFIDNQLVMDLGGVDPPSGQYVEIDRLGLEDGLTYKFQFYHAQRRTGDSIFRLRTNLVLDSAKAIPSITAQFD